MRKLLLTVAIVLFIGVTIPYGINHYRLQIPMKDVLKDDYRNIGIEAVVHYKCYLDPLVLIYDLQSISSSNTKADVFRVLLQFADKMKNRGFQEVELSFRGKTKFILSGSHFQSMGRDYPMENRIYTMRMFPQNLKNPNGTKAYTEWSGEYFAVTMRQMQDFGEFCQRWCSQ